jgi:universal stress protein A
LILRDSQSRDSSPFGFGCAEIASQPRPRNAQRFAKAGERCQLNCGNLGGMRANTLKANPIRPETTPALHFKKILAPVDFSTASKNGFKCAMRFAEEFGAELVALYVLEPAPAANFMAIPGAVPFCETDFSWAEKNLRSLVASAKNGTAERPHWKVRVGVPSHEIVGAAKEMDADLIVIATHGYTGWKHFCIGSTAERVVRAAPCPVLVVREKEHEFS